MLLKRLLSPFYETEAKKENIHFNSVRSAHEPTGSRTHEHTQGITVDFSFGLKSHVDAPVV